MSADNTIEKALDSQIAVKAARLRKLEAALGVAREDLTAARRHIVETDDTIAAQRATLRDLDARKAKLAAIAPALAQIEDVVEGRITHASMVSEYGQVQIMTYAQLLDPSKSGRRESGAKILALYDSGYDDKPWIAPGRRGIAWMVAEYEDGGSWTKWRLARSEDEAKMNATEDVVALAAKPGLAAYYANTCVTNCDALGIPVLDSLRVLAEKHRVDARKAALDKARAEFARAQAELAKLEEQGR